MAAPEWEVLATNLRVEAELLRILSLLDGIPLAVFKGPILTQQIYGDLRKRASADNDVFVPSKHAPEALERLLAAGFTPKPGLLPREALEGDGQVALYPRGDRSAVALDLHVRPFSRPYFEVPEALVLQNLEEVEVQGRSLPSFGPELSFCHLVGHFVQHHLERRLLPPMGMAWDRWHERFDTKAARELVARTCGLPAFEYVLALLAAGCHTSAPVPLITTTRARVVLGAWGPLRDAQGEPPGDLLRKTLSLYLTTPPGRLAAGAASALFLRHDQLESRYGTGPHALLTARHLVRVLIGR